MRVCLFLSLCVYVWLFTHVRTHVYGCFLCIYAFVNGVGVGLIMCYRKVVLISMNKLDLNCTLSNMSRFCVFCFYLARLCAVCLIVWLQVYSLSPERYDKWLSKP